MLNFFYQQKEKQHHNKWDPMLDTIWIDFYISSKYALIYCYSMDAPSMLFSSHKHSLYGDPSHFSLIVYSHFRVSPKSRHVSIHNINRHHERRKSNDTYQNGSQLSYVPHIVHIWLHGFCRDLWVLTKWSNCIRIPKQINVKSRMCQSGAKSI